MPKETKTNAMRILDRNKISYIILSYDCDEFIDGLHTSELTGVSPKQSFKTLVAKGKSEGFCVFVIPVACELDMKKAAKAAGEKSIELVAVKDINAFTGYVRGGVSPIGMKKQFPTYICESAQCFDKIYLSGGRLGSTVCLAPSDAAKITGGHFADICAE